jgi:hypothetical protein
MFKEQTNGCFELTTLQLFFVTLLTCFFSHIDSSLQRLGARQNIFGFIHEVSIQNQIKYL